MKRQTTSLAALGVALVLATAPAFAQRGRGAGGPPAGKGPGSEPGASASSHGSEASSHGTSALSNRSPGEVLRHSPAIAGKIKALTGEDALTACGGFKSLGQCVAAAHVAKNLHIAFDGTNSLKSLTTGSGAVSLGKAIQQLDPNADAKPEAKKAEKQAKEDLKQSGS